MNVPSFPPASRRDLLAATSGLLVAAVAYATACEAADLLGVRAHLNGHSTRSNIWELVMDNSKLSLSFGLTGVAPAVCDAGAREADEIVTDRTGSYAAPPAAGPGLSTPKIRSVIAELCSAIRSALDGERCTAEESLQRAAEILQEMGETVAASSEQARGGLAPWQIRKVTSHIEAHLDRSIRNEDLAALVRLNASHFGRAFRNSLGEPPHEYVIRRRIERAQGLMLSTDAPLSAIALECGLADQSHLTRLFPQSRGRKSQSVASGPAGHPVSAPELAEIEARMARTPAVPAD